MQHLCKLYARDIEKPSQLSGHNNMVTLKPTYIRNRQTLIHIFTGQKEVFSKVCHEDFAVLEQFCSKIITLRL